MCNHTKLMSHVAVYVVWNQFMVPIIDGTHLIVETFGGWTIVQRFEVDLIIQ